LDLLSSDRWTEPAIHPVSGQTRITLTGKIINNAREILFIATGKNKSAVLKEIITDSEKAKSYPAYHIRPVNGAIQWFIDREAAVFL